MGDCTKNTDEVNRDLDNLEEDLRREFEPRIKELETENKRLRDALSELVFLKKIKEYMKDLPKGGQYQSYASNYRARKEPAWKAARGALASYKETK